MYVHLYSRNVLFFLILNCSTTREFDSFIVLRFGYNKTFFCYKSNFKPLRFSFFFLFRCIKVFLTLNEYVMKYDLKIIYYTADCSTAGVTKCILFL